MQTFQQIFLNLLMKLLTLYSNGFRTASGWFFVSSGCICNRLLCGYGLVGSNFFGGIFFAGVFLGVESGVEVSSTLVPVFNFGRLNVCLSHLRINL
jgi:hypothetical protein